MITMQLNYTEEMKKQDALWENEQEDFNVMISLYEEIMEEAEILGYNGIYDAYIVSGEAVIELFENEAEKESYSLSGESNDHLFGYCSPLIRTLNEILQKNTKLSKKQIALFTENEQFEITSGCYYIDDNSHPHNKTTEAIWHIASVEKGHITDEDVLELIYFDSDKNKVVAQWHNSNSGIEYRVIS